ncbi:MAG: tetratricopeptide repeat protein [Planctomycetota bacterium]
MTEPSSPHNTQALPGSRPHWPRHLLACIVLLTLTAIAYANADHERLFFDSIQLPLDRMLTDWPASLQRFWSSGLRPNQELTNLTFAANHVWNIRQGLPGFDVSSFVFVNVALHGACVLLLYGFIFRLAPRREGMILPALFAAAWFAVHPVHAASVLYVVQRRGILATLFYLLTLHGYLFARRPNPIVRRMLAWIGVMLFFFLALKSKNMSLTLPLAVVLIEFCLRAPNTSELRRILKWAIPIVCLFMIASIGLLYVLGTLDLSRGTISGVGTATSMEPWKQFITQMRALAAAWGLLLLPLPSSLCFDHVFQPSQRWTEPAVLICMALHAGIVSIAVVAAIRGRVLLSFGLLLFYISAIPWLFIPQSEQLVEYKMYLPGAGAACIVAAALEWLWRRHHASLMVALGVVVLAAIVPITHHRNNLVKSPDGLWRDVISKYPRHFRAWVSLGYSLAEANQFPQALDAYHRAIGLDPYNAQLRYYNGNALRALGRKTEAVSEYQEAHRIAGGDLHVAVNLAATLMDLGRTGEAVELLKRAIEQRWPSTDMLVVARAHFNLANAMASTGSLSDAETEYRNAIMSYEAYPQAHYGLGLLLNRLGRSNEAVEELHFALRVKPDFTEAQRALEDIMARPSEAAP